MRIYKRMMLAVCAAGLASACSHLIAVQCVQDSNCDLDPGGVCAMAPTGNRWCSHPDAMCPSGLRYYGNDPYPNTGDGLAGMCVALIVDAGTMDAGTARDAAGVAAFDVVYPREWRFSVSGPVSGYLLIVNRGPVALSTNTLQVKSISDDHPIAIVRVNATIPSTFIPSGEAGGKLSPASTAVLVDSGLTTETRTDIDTDYLTLEVDNAPAGTYDINVMLVLGLDNLDAPMPMVIHVVPGPVIYANPEVGNRVTVYR